MSRASRILRVLPESSPWQEWLERTGEPLPDLDSLPSIPQLPDPLVMEIDGRRVPVETPDDWRRRREQIKGLFHRYVIGGVPPPPGNIRPDVTSTREEDRSTIKEITLEFGAEHRAKLWMELIIPKGDGPFPVFVTQHNHRPWALVAVTRGYIGCVYAGSDSRDDTDGFLEVYPEYDWSRLARRAWAAGRCIDYLETLPFVDTERIALTGHSRNGKQSLIAAALDERVSIVISSSSGAGGAMPYRYFSEAHFGEGIELLTRVFPDWFHQRLRFFAGSEDRLPVDNHELIALSAPRPCLLSTALNDSVESTWAMQQTYLAAKQVYDLLDASDRLRILWRHGSHETCATIIEDYLDWCDTHFGRGKLDLPGRMIHPCDFDSWRDKSEVRVDVASLPKRSLDDLMVLEDGGVVRTVEGWHRRRAEIRESVRWILGEVPPYARNPGGRYGAEPGHVAMMLGRSSAGEGVSKQSVAFGDYISGDVYVPADLPSSTKVPAILWLHPFSFSNGYVAGYRRGEQAFLRFCRERFAVFCFDQMGFGRRIEEVERFYDRHPRWSLLGKMVRDARAALGALLELPFVDRERVYGIGYGLGGIVGLHAAAFDDRLAGFASVCGFTPMRLDKAEKGTGGIRRWSHLYMLLPKLGYFLDNEERIPYDFHMLLATLAPRAALVVSPALDREATLEDVKTCVRQARKAYEFFDAEDNLRQDIPEDYNRFGPEVQNTVIEWLKSL
jgi:dienelactone hydrolase